MMIIDHKLIKYFDFIVKPHYFFKPRRGNVLRTMCRTCSEDVAYPLKPPSSQEIRSHPGKASIYEPKTLNETMLPMKRKKSITISHTQQMTTPISTPILTKEKEWDMKNRRDSHQEQEKVDK